MHKTAFVAFTTVSSQKLWTVFDLFLPTQKQYFSR